MSILTRFLVSFVLVAVGRDVAAQESDGLGTDVAQLLAQALAKGELKREFALSRFDALDRTAQLELISTWKQLVQPEGLGLELHIEFRSRLKKAPLAVAKSDSFEEVRRSPEPALLLQTRASSPGWSMGGAIVGFAAAAGAFGLSLASELTKEDQIPAIPLGVAATVLTASLAPVAFAGGSSARRGDARGVLALRIVGWIAYGLSMVNAVALIGLGAAEIEPPDGSIVSAGGLAAVSLLSFATDALVSRRQAIAETRVADSGSVVPVIGVGTVGIAMSF
jgi:hypothetical protein